MDTKIKNLLKTYFSSEDKILFFKSLTNLHKALLLYMLEKKDKLFILHYLKESEIILILRNLDPDEITDIVQILPKWKQKQIISKLDKEYKKKIDFLLKFAPNSAGGLMSLNYIIVSNSDSKKEILDKIKKHKELGREEPTILVLGRDNQFLGELKISSLLFETSKNIFSDLKKLPTVNYNENQENVIDIFKRNRKEKLVVLNEDESIMGIIFAKDIFKAIEEENTEDYYGLVGLNKDEDINDGIFTKVKFRLGWLIINLATAFMAAGVVAMFKGTISKFVLLAVFMPVIAGMGGNAATQTTAILIRSLALKKINSKMIGKIIFSEIIAAILNGLVIGLVVAIIAYSYDKNIAFTLIVGVAVVGNMIVAGFFGTIVPLILKLLKFDPATSSTVFVTTATDVLGFFILLGLAKLFLF